MASIRDSVNTVTMDNVVNYWNNQPCNIKHSSKDMNTCEYFEEVSTKRYFVEPHIPEFADFDNYRNKKVLEVGCGIGTDAQEFAKNGANYKGIDLTEKSIDICKNRFRLFNLEGDFEVGNIEEYCSPTNTYDLIYSFGVLHHTPNIDNALINIYNMLKPGGKFKCMLYAKNSLKYFKILDGLDQYEAQNNVPIANTYTHDEVNKLFSAHNFSNISIKQTHIFPYKIPEYKQGQYVKEDYFQSMSSELFSCLNKNLGWHLCITCNK
jgi:2-polyprenyl-3-methyl-5-hydroxy-6-metoxy-1,4-benzoquinol methylase